MSVSTLMLFNSVGFSTETNTVKALTPEQIVKQFEADLQATNPEDNNSDNQTTFAETVRKNSCETHRVTIDAAKTKLEKEKNGNWYPGTSSLQECDQFLLGNMKNLYSNGIRKSINTQKDALNEFVLIEYCDESGSKETEKLVQKALRCDAAAYLISTFNRDWNDTEQVQPSKTQGGNNGGMVQNNGQQQSPTQAMSQAQGIKCVSEGIETVDYDDCKKFTDQLGLLDVATTFANNAQSAVYSAKLGDKQIEYAQEENSATGALKAQGSSFDMQQDMYQQRAVIDGAKLAYLYSIYEKIPSAKDLTKKCDAYKGDKVITAGGLNPDNMIPMTHESGKSACLAAASAMGGKFAFLQNQAAKDQMKSKLVGVATSLGSNALLSKLMGDRAKDVKKAIAKINEFEAIDPITLTEEALKENLCTTDPTNIKCSGSGLNSDFDSIGENIIVFGSNSTGTNYGQSKGEEVGTVDDSSSSQSGSVDKIGSIVDKVNQGTEMDDSRAAKVTASGNGRSGGGGGGSAGGVGLGGGGDVQKGSEASVTAAKQSLNSAYGGGGGSLSVTGGMGINKKNATGNSEDNPFGKLFNKDQKAAGDVVNFREIASTDKVGTKNDDLFKMISNRYNRVNAEKRLIEYELTK